MQVHVHVVHVHVVHVHVQVQMKVQVQVQKKVRRRCWTSARASLHPLLRKVLKKCVDVDV